MRCRPCCETPGGGPAEGAPATGTAVPPGASCCRRCCEPPGGGPAGAALATGGATPSDPWVWRKTVAPAADPGASPTADPVPIDAGVPPFREPPNLLFSGERPPPGGACVLTSTE